MASESTGAPTSANTVRKIIDGPRSSRFAGLDFVIEASVSRSSADASSLVSLVFRRGQ